MPIPRAFRLLLPLAAASLASAAAAQGGPAAPMDPASKANSAISEAVREGSNPYRPAQGTDPDDDRRARCQALQDEYNAASKQRQYKSSGPAAQTAQGRTIPKIERDKSLESLRETYRANCT